MKYSFDNVSQCCSASVLAVRIFIPTMSNAAAKSFSALGGQIYTMEVKLNLPQKQPTSLAFSDCDALIGSAELVHLVHASYKRRGN